MPTILTQLSTEPLTAERTWTVEEIPVLTASLSLPAPVEGNERAVRRIRRYYQLQSRAFLRYCEHWLLPEAEAEYPVPHWPPAPRCLLSTQSWSIGSPTTKMASGAFIRSPGSGVPTAVPC